MVLSLHNLKPAIGSTKTKKRLGRGDASGHGSYSTRGQKGQKSRTGGRNKLKRLGFKKILQKLPKRRGFKSIKSKNQVINLTDLNNHFTDGSIINPVSLLKAELIKSVNLPVKILGLGKLTLKNLEIKDIKVSSSARQHILELGGKIN